MPSSPELESGTLLVALDRYRPKSAYSEVGLFARWLHEHGIPAIFITNKTALNADQDEVWPGVPIIKLPIPENRKLPLDHRDFYQLVWRNRRKIRYIWLYRNRRYVLFAALVVKLFGGKVLLKFDGQGGVFPGTNALARSPLRLLLPFLSRSGAEKALQIRYPSGELPRGLVRRLRHALLYPIRWATHDLPLALADVLMVEDPEIAASIGAYNVRDKVVLYPHGVAFHEFRAAEQRWRAEGGRREAVVLSVGRIDRPKGFQNVIEAFSHVPEGTRKDWRLRIVGPVEDPVYAAELRAQVSRLGISDVVEFVPGLYGDDLYREYLGASIFTMAHPTRFEGAPIAGASQVIQEAMAFGCPVISTAVGSVHYLLDYGRAGILVPPDDTRGLAMAFSDLMINQEARERLGNIGQLRAQDRFSMEHNNRLIADRLGLEFGTRTEAVYVSER